MAFFNRRPISPGFAGGYLFFLGGRDHEGPIKGEARRAVRATPHPPLQWFTGRFCKRADVPKGTCCAAWASAPTEGADHPHQRVFRQSGHFLEERAGRLDDFHLLTDGRAAGFLCALANRLPGNVHLIVASRDRFLPRRGDGAAGGEGLPDRHGAAAAEPHGAVRIRPALRQRFSRELRWFTDAMDTFSQG